MEHKVNDIINYNHNGETIYLKVVEDFDCINCFFYSAACCSDIRNDIGDCLGSRRSDKTPVIFKKVNNKTMNENIDLTKILKDCPKGWEFYSTVLGYVKFEKIIDGNLYPIIVRCKNEVNENITDDGKLIVHYDGECTLFPSKEQRDWSKFTAPWYKTDKFDPKTLKPFDKVLIRINNADTWRCDFFSYIKETDIYKYITIKSGYKYCIPYNNDTKHLVGTTDEAPEYYRYWEE